MLLNPKRAIAKAVWLNRGVVVKEHREDISGITENTTVRHITGCHV